MPVENKRSPAWMLSKSRLKNDGIDYYPTPPFVAHALVDAVDIPHRIWEPAAGKRHISNELTRLGYDVISTDMFDYGAWKGDVDYLYTHDRNVDGIITNPPFLRHIPERFIERTMDSYRFGAFLLRLGFLESKGRYGLFTERYTPSSIHVFSGRFSCDESLFDLDGSMLRGMETYAWYVWDYRSGQTKRGDTRLNWIDTRDAFERWVRSLSL
jgi:hypothetical protein